MKTFLRAEWRKLAMANYAVDPALLLPHLPHKTELDYWNNTCYVSLVGFMFLNTRVKGFKIPFHVNFEEINLRFYVRYKDGAEWKRGVVFTKEIVSRPALTFVANTVYKEKYETMPTRHQWTGDADSLNVTYAWKKGEWNSFHVNCHARAEKINAGSEEEFITEHFWGYTKTGELKTAEYGVEHPTWDVYPVKNYIIDVNFEKVYGSAFSFLKQQKPLSVFLAEGSEICVKHGREI